MNHLKQQERRFEAPDEFLQYLVWHVNANDGTVKIPVTLFVGGLIISGDLIGRKTYHDQFASTFASIFDNTAAPETVQAIAAILKDFVLAYNTPQDGNLQDEATEEEEEDKEAEELLALRQIHLENARLYYPNALPIPHNEGLLWRGRLSSVDGFALGRIVTTRL